MPSDVLLSRRDDPERHERAVPRRVRLLDANVSDLRGLEPRGRLSQLLLPRDRQHDSVRPAREPSGTRLTRRVDEVGGLDPSREVGAHDDVVGEVPFRGAMATRSWVRAYGVVRRTSRACKQIGQIRFMRL